LGTLCDSRRALRLVVCYGMRESLPLIVGLGIIVLALGVIWLAPESAAAIELRRSYGIEPSGERGVRTRRDHLKSAGLAALMAIALTVTSVVAATLMDRLPNGSRGNLIASTYMFGGFLMTIVTAVVALVALWKSVFWRIELPDTPSHRRAFADAIDRLVDGTLSAEDRAEYVDVRYLQPEIEQIRRSTLHLLKRHGNQLPENVRDQVKEFTAHIRGSVDVRAES
jgi:hypothetical protein